MGKKSKRTKRTGIVTEFVADELRLLAIYVCIVLKHAIIDMFAYGPHGLTRVIFELAEAFAVLKALRAESPANEPHSRICRGAHCTPQRRRRTKTPRTRLPRR